MYIYIHTYAFIFTYILLYIYAYVCIHPREIKWYEIWKTMTSEDDVFLDSHAATTWPRKIENLETGKSWGKITQNILDSPQHPRKNRPSHRPSRIFNVSRMTLGFVGKSCISVNLYMYASICLPNPPNQMVNGDDFPCGHGPFQTDHWSPAEFHTRRRRGTGPRRKDRGTPLQILTKVGVAQIARDILNIAQEIINYIALISVILYIYTYKT